jgi:hypothetical protein
MKFKELLLREVMVLRTLDRGFLSIPGDLWPVFQCFRPLGTCFARIFDSVWAVVLRYIGCWFRVHWTLILWYTGRCFCVVCLGQRFLVVVPSCIACLAVFCAIGDGILKHTRGEAKRSTTKPSPEGGMASGVERSPTP